jgi:hypothetical protein
MNHSNFLINDYRYNPLLWDVLAQQSVKALIVATLPVSKWSGKVSGAVELLINQPVRRKLSPILIDQYLVPDGGGLKLLNMAELTKSHVLLATLEMTATQSCVRP